MNMEELLTSNGTQLKIETGYRLLQYLGQSPSVFEINYPSKAEENMWTELKEWESLLFATQKWKEPNLWTEQP